MFWVDFFFKINFDSSYLPNKVARQEHQNRKLF